jgi:proteic killer suppression protein
MRNPSRIRRILLALDASTRPEQLNLPGLNFHALKGADKGRFSVWVGGNYRITFGWSADDAIDVDLEDYH